MDIENLYSIYLDHPTIIIDSRKIEKACLFFALKGENFDGNQFAADALAKGAAYAVVDNEALAVDDRYLLVDDVLTALQLLSRHHRRQFTIPVIAITGSNGKTTTKELVSQVLGRRYRIHYTQGNYNNHIGVPLTLLAMPQDTEVAVIEMGANHQGEIGFLCEIAEPTHGLITNIGRAHLEGFGGIEGVKKGKSELYRYLSKTKGMAFVNRDAEYLTELSESVEKKVYYKKSSQPTSSDPYFEVKLLETVPHLSVSFLDKYTGELLEIQSHLHGSYNFDNLMTAVTLGKYFKIPGVAIKIALESYIPKNNRSQFYQQDGNTFILDAYNANPTSVEAALNAFTHVEATQKIAILGDMLELGEESRVEHERIAHLAVAQSYDDLILVGKAFAAIAEHLQLRHFISVENLRSWFYSQSYEGVHFLLKASRGIQLEKLLSKPS